MTSKMRIQFYVSILLLCCVAVTVVSTTGTTDPSEVKALADIKSKLIDPMNYFANWTKGDPCTSNWTGVLCFENVSTDGYLHVQELQLLSMNLSGTLSPALGQLSQLQILDFMWNKLTGSIPSEIGSIASLKLLLLNGNKLTGSLPEELGHLSNLVRLQVDQNLISGSIPTSFANLSSIRHFHLNNNTIGGQIPPELSNLSTLLHLLVDNNNLSGYLPPGFSTMPNLRILQLDNNNFNGNEIPPSYGSFSKLVKLSLRNCSLAGPMPDLSPIPFLSYIDLSMNSLTGPIPTNRLSDNITIIVLSDNRFNGSVPANFSDFRLLQKLSLENNLLTGSVSTNIWQHVTLISPAKLTIDLENNAISNITGQLNPPANVTLSLAGNPVCNNGHTQNVSHFCGQQPGVVDTMFPSSNSTSCKVLSCPTDNYYEYVPASPNPCFCTSPLRVGYRLKSPSFSYFPPYELPFEEYLSGSLYLELYQLYIDSYAWEEGPRLRMYLKLYPAYTSNRSTFNESEVLRIRDAFVAWQLPDNDFFGPYELLNFTLLGPYSTIILPRNKTGMSKGVLVAIVLASIAIVASISSIVFLLVARRRNKPQPSMARNRPLSRISMKIEGVKEFTFRELAMSTDNFNSSTEVGKGGYGKVYRGCLFDKTVVAIKRAEEGSFQGQQEFLTEIELLSRLHHRNLVSLIGYCDEEGEQMLVYQFMPNGNLRDWLSGKTTESLNFKTRLQAALGSAKGILYLHTEANPPVFHRDIKASNILLDSNLTAKVSDFGLSRLAPALNNEGVIPTHVSTVVKGTPGYLDPEYFLTHKLTDKSDVYSLGVVFLELLTGMHPISHGKNIVREKVQEPTNSLVPGTNTYVTYLITTCTNIPDFGSPEFSVRRRFRDVVTLSDRLTESYRGFFIPPRPDKSIVESQVMQKQEFVEQRRVALEKYLRRLATHPVIKKSDELKVFLQVQGNLPWLATTDVASRMLDGAVRLPKQLLGDGPAVAPHEVVQPAKGGRDLLRLFKELKQSVANDWSSSKPPVVEEDKEFLEKKDRIQDLEMQLGNASQQAEALVKAQQDMGETMGELGLVFIKLTKFENEEAVTNAQRVRATDMKSLATAAVKASRFYRVLNLHTVKHLDTLHEYLGLMMGIRSAFVDRSSALLTVQTLLSELSSLQSRSEKLEAASSKIFGGDKMRMRKVEELNETIRVTEDAKHVANREYERIKENNRIELERLDAERREDFLNMLKGFVVNQVGYEEKIANVWGKVAEETSSYAREKS